MLLPFPFTDLSATRVRPALVVSADEFHQEGDDLVVAMITSQERSGRGDYGLNDWQDAGLLHPSWVRSKLATLSQGLVRFSPGRISSRDSDEIDRRLTWALGING